MNPVVHFEMPYEDKNRMAAFYTKAFGWKPQMLGPEMGEYVVVTTAEADEKGRPKNPGTINGGFYKKPADPLGQHPSIVIAVTDIQEALKKVRRGGREGARGADGYSWHWFVCRLSRYRRQPSEPSPAFRTNVAYQNMIQPMRKSVLLSWALRPKPS